ncbi:MAG TPA: mycofactocin-coupled SDR family oxidoreductase [Acidimicrobiales bacterium]|nr:mycofactocin-coupled SDR family oxidoreductase [Acidimicrobiales bacterium]
MAGSTNSDAPVALVTGAARGIGAATVAALTGAGWRVIATDACADDPRLAYPLGTRAELDGVAARAPSSIRAVTADVRDVGALRDAVDEGLDEFGRLDAAIGCAGVLAGGDPAWETTADTWNVQVEVNLTGMWHLATAAIPAILRSTGSADDAAGGQGAGHGSFVAVSSAAGTTGLPMLSAYAASKHGVIGLVRSMAAELAPNEVTANVVCPGSTRTPILDASAAVYGLDDAEAFRSHHLLDRLIEPSEVAALIAYLCSDAAAAITGAVLPVDAGMTAHGG